MLYPTLLANDDYDDKNDDDDWNSGMCAYCVWATIAVSSEFSDLCVWQRARGGQF